VSQDELRKLFERHPRDFKDFVVRNLDQILGKAFIRTHVEENFAEFFPELFLGGEKSVAFKQILELSDDQWVKFSKLLPSFVGLWGNDKIRAVTDHLLPEFGQIDDPSVRDGSVVTDLLGIIASEIHQDEEILDYLKTSDTIVLRISGDGFSDKNSLKPDFKTCTSITVALLSKPSANNRGLSTRSWSRSFLVPISVMFEHESIPVIKAGKMMR
jgi:hypothetical protein